MFASRVTGNIEDCLEVATAVLQKKKKKKKEKKKLIHYKYLMKNQNSKCLIFLKSQLTIDMLSTI